MRLDISGFGEVEAYLEGLARSAPAAAHEGVQHGLDAVAGELRLQLAQGGPRVAVRKNNLYTQYSVGRRTVAATFPGLGNVGWIAVTGLEQGGKQDRHRFAAQAQADQHARAYAEQLRQREGEAEITINVQTLPDGAEGTLTADHEDDDATQRAFDAGADLAAAAAEDTFRKAMDI